ncbi:unnamed protein product [Acanthosepion pharaonis]|uniref:Uncharacterized protein n=1 Tax=Acanthosepion pharaonis TaxID=158019 RepID=A0A812CMB6_ACAPH|nr:unnamed protein product [Sepia pharaonis]
MRPDSWPPPWSFILDLRLILQGASLNSASINTLLHPSNFYYYLIFFTHSPLHPLGTLLHFHFLYTLSLSLSQLELFPFSFISFCVISVYNIFIFSFFLPLFHCNIAYFVYSFSFRSLTLFCEASFHNIFPSLFLFSFFLQLDFILYSPSIFLFFLSFPSLSIYVSLSCLFPFCAACLYYICSFFLPLFVNIAPLSHNVFIYLCFLSTFLCITSFIIDFSFPFFLYSLCYIYSSLLIFLPFPLFCSPLFFLLTSFYNNFPSVLLFPIQPPFIIAIFSLFPFFFLGWLHIIFSLSLFLSFSTAASICYRFFSPFSHVAALYSTFPFIFISPFFFCNLSSFYLSLSFVFPPFSFPLLIIAVFSISPFFWVAYLHGTFTLSFFPFLCVASHYSFSSLISFFSLCSISLHDNFPSFFITSVFSFPPFFFPLFCLSFFSIFFVAALLYSSFSLSLPFSDSLPCGFFSFSSLFRLSSLWLFLFLFPFQTLFLVAFSLPFSDSLPCGFFIYICFLSTFLSIASFIIDFYFSFFLFLSFPFPTLLQCGFLYFFLSFCILIRCNFLLSLCL